MPSDSHSAVVADVLVVGGGMAGAVAALAARARGARVALVRRSPGASAISSGAVCVASDPRALAGDLFHSREGPIAAARSTAARQPEHPYAALGQGLFELEEALQFAARELPAVLCPPEARSRWIATPFGSARECALCQPAMVAGDLAEVEGPVAVVGLRGHLGFDARFVAAGLNRLEGLGAPRAEPVEIDLFMREADAVSRPHELARAFEAPGAAESAGALLRQALPRNARIALFPPVLGLAPGNRVAERIAEVAGLPVAETLSDVPSVPGLRLDAAIQAGLAARGVELLLGDLRGGRPGESVDLNGRSITAPSWVLATGRFFAGGIVRRGRLEEPTLGIPVEVAGPPRGERATPASLPRRPATSLTRRVSRAVQSLFSAGVRIDPALRPLDGDGRLFHPRLHAAGAVICGSELPTDGTGLGLAILTGYLAGRAAAAGV